jgi:hypothetical protein
MGEDQNLLDDAEIEAMREAFQALKDIEPTARLRVVRWLADRFEIHFQHTAKPGEKASDPNDALSQFESFADLHGGVSPSTEAESALVGGYWFQVVQKNADFSSQQVNDELKNLGNAVGNITAAFNSLRERKPALVLQVQKSGTTKQARKRYKLTQAGIREIERLLESSQSKQQE